MRRPEELDDLAGIILPGGESTTIDKLSRIFERARPAGRGARAGLPAYGSCAGMILLADRVLDGTDDQQTFGGLDDHRPAQRLRPSGGVLRGRCGAGRGRPAARCTPCSSGPLGWSRSDHVEVLGAVTPPGTDEAKIIAVRQGNLLATSFHPEVTGDLRMHRYFLDLVRAA